jgi:hypothetical protein
VLRPVAAGERPRDVPGALRVDQLLDDRPRERLERLGLAQDAQLRPRLDHPPEHRVAAMRAVKRLEVVVEAEHEPHPGERVSCRVFRVGVGAQEDAIVAPGGFDEGEFAINAHRPAGDAAVELDESARAGRAGRLARPRRGHGEVDDHAVRARSTSSSSNRASGSSSAAPNSSRSRPSR